MYVMNCEVMKCTVFALPWKTMTYDIMMSFIMELYGNAFSINPGSWSYVYALNMYTSVTMETMPPVNIWKDKKKNYDSN